MKDPRYNILLFFTDQQRADTCGCHGSTLGLTPNLDTLAKEGITFQNAITCQPVCGPARAVLQTGVYATKNGCFRNAIAIQDDGKTIAHCMTNNGYTANYFGKWHLSLTELEPILQHQRCGYTGAWKASDLLEFTSDAYEGYLFDEQNEKITFSNQYRSDYITGLVTDFIEKYEDEKPFFTMVSYLEPHHQNTKNRFIAPNGYAKQYKHLPIPEDLNKNDTTEADWKSEIADYYGCIKKLDENLGEIITTLKNKGIYENTIILFTSDHGCHFRTRNNEYKRSCHESSVHIPLVIRGGKYVGGTSILNPISLIDIPPSILEMADIEPPSQMQGRKINTLLDGGEWDDSVFIQISESQVARALRTSRYKYGVTAPNANGWNDKDSEIYIEQYLYDLEYDPYELNNLIEDPKYNLIRSILRDKLKIKIIEAGEPQAEIIPLNH